VGWLLQEGGSASPVNQAVLAVMHARAVWGLRKVALLEVGGRFGRGTHELLLGLPEALFVSAHVRGAEDPADCDRPHKLLHTLKPDTG
jgi:acetoin utilization deacetylase AcuC-like enzyme